MTFYNTEEKSPREGGAAQTHTTRTPTSSARLARLPATAARPWRQSEVFQALSEEPPPPKPLPPPPPLPIVR